MGLSDDAERWIRPTTFSDRAGWSTSHGWHTAIPMLLPDPTIAMMLRRLAHSQCFFRHPLADQSRV